MIFYRLNIAGDPTEEGVDNDEWFSSLAQAARRRRELIKQWPDEPDYQIDRVYVRQLPPRELALRLLNRTGWCDKTEIVVAEYVPPEAAGESI